MRALTLTQPWAGLVASGIKLVENRPRRMIKAEDFGKRFAIHASREIDSGVYQRIADIAPELATRLSASGRVYDQSFDAQPWFKLSRITSSVIAVATLDSVVFDETGLLGREIDKQLGDQRRWFFGPIGYVLRDVIALETPVPCRGFQGFWTLPSDVAAKVGEQVCDECRGPGVYFLNGEPQTCICMESQA